MLMQKRLKKTIILGLTFSSLVICGITFAYAEDWDFISALRFDAIAKKAAEDNTYLDAALGQAPFEFESTIYNPTGIADARALVRRESAKLIG